MTALIILALLAFGFYLFHKLFKVPKLNNLVLTSGGVKTGKSSLACYYALRAYKRELFWFNVRCKLVSLFAKKKLPSLEKPLLYSNIPLACDYVPLTRDIIMRRKRMAYRSVVFVDEASLLADSMAWTDDDVNENIRLFFKLIAHETRGGRCIIDSQQPSDLHFGIKRNLSSYFYIHRIVKLPFFVVCYVREMLYSDESGVQNVFNDDVEFGMRRIIFSKKIWKKFDCYAFSGLTDHLPVENNVVHGADLPDLKVRGDYVTFHVKREKRNNKKESK